MSVLAAILVAVVAALHAGFAYLEMVAWRTPRARKAFGTTEQLAAETVTMAANQGLYNLFISAGLLWGLVTDGDTAFQFRCVFLIFVIVAGIFGALTVSRRILAVQAAPAAIALAFVLVSH